MVSISPALRVNNVFCEGALRVNVFCEGRSPAPIVEGINDRMARRN